MNDIHAIFKIVDLLTEKNNANELKRELCNIAKENLKALYIIIYEIFNSRNDNHSPMTNEELALNSLDYSEPSIVVNENESLKNCILAKKIIHSFIDSKNHLFFPILESGKVTHIVSIIFQDYSDENKYLTENIIKLFENQLSLIRSKDNDFLTGLFNRKAFDTVMNSISSQSVEKKSGHNFYKNYTHLAIMDIDHFKLVNDRFGHMIGDEILILVSQILNNTLRYEDLKFRFGGEEFVILLKNTNDINAYNLLERTRKSIESFSFPQIGDVTISIGFTGFDKSNLSTMVIDKADRALYYVKEHGRNQVYSYDRLLENNMIESVDDKKSEIVFW